MAVTSVEIQKRVGITYKKVDYWTRQGYLQTWLSDPTPGSGSRRQYADAEMDVARLMKFLSEHGFLSSSQHGAPKYIREMCEWVRSNGLHGKYEVGPVTFLLDKMNGK